MYIKDFRQLNKDDVAIAGGKGASLGEMMQVNIPIPKGFVILSNSFEEFIKGNDLNVEIDAILDTVDCEKIHTVEEASGRIQALIINTEISKEIRNVIIESFKELNSRFVAVRSSATSEDSVSAAWAGQLNTYLNVTRDDLLESVIRCWASLFTPRAIFYRFEKKLHGTDISVAVVIQEMVESEESGVAFSVHPVTEDSNQIIIEAGLGLGEAIVSGQITPDSYVVDKEDWHIIDINVNEQSKGLYRKENGGNEWKELGEKGKKQVLNEKEILELSKLIIKIENHYGFPVDVEWAKEGGKFYITQSRPITTLTNKEEKIILIKKFSREHSLFYMENWSYSQIYHTFKILGGHIKNLIYLSESENPQISSWYDPMEVLQLYGLVVEKSKNPFFFKWIEKEFERLWQKIEPYIKKRKKINSIYELRKFRENIIKFYGPYIVVYVSPDISELDENYKKLSLRLREKVQEIINDIDEVYLDFFIVKFPNYEVIANFLTAEEIFSLEKSNFSNSKLKKIRERKEKGYFLLNNKLYLYNELAKVLKMNNLNLENYKVKKKVFTGNLEKNLDMLGIRLEDKKSAVSGEATASKNQIKGQIAYKGRVIGRVKIISSIKDLSNVGHCDILVAAMTMPKYLPAMKKAKGFITDEGGVTCHAAIIAREMKKPCVIGTKFATQVLKDGDMVEVDADEGVVKILENDGGKQDLFEKAYTRDTSAIIQQAWYSSLRNSKKTYNWSLPEGHPVIHYMSEGIIEVWENESYTQELLDFLFGENKKDDFFFKKHIANYKKILQQLRKYWKKGELSSVEEFEKVINLIFEGMLGFIVMYYSACDERTPESIRKKAFLIRDADVYFDENDKLIRKSLLNIYPSIKGYETTILSNEIKNIPKKEELKQRKENFIFIGEQEKRTIPFKEFVNSHSEFQFNIEVPSKDIKDVIKGSSAYHGKIKAKIRILKRKEQINEIEKGEILVSPMTTPDFLPAMKKASAFITDEGGITCHAAIVARELKKPCIIGTKFATQVLKDGDLVEVDANEGVVKILDKEKSVILSRSFSREHSLFYVYVWSKNNTRHLSDWLDDNFNNILFIKEKDSNKISVLFDNNELEKFNESIIKAYREDKDFFNKLKRDFYNLWDGLFPYVSNKKKIKSISELEEFYKNWINWWSPMAIFMVTGDIKEIPKKYRDLAIKTREDTQEYSDEGDNVFVEFFRNKFPEYNDLTYLITPQEVFLLKDDKLSEKQKSEIISRSKGCALINNKLLSLQELHEFLDDKKLKLEALNSEEITELKGQVGCKGYAEGKVCLIQHKDDILKLEKGEILVTEMTSPEFVPAMKKASAIITDEGGVTSHAAIASRELNKPCVIGTKFATQVLKDGDEVEVDAEKGIVKILKKN